MQETKYVRKTESFHSRTQNANCQKKICQKDTESLSHRKCSAKIGKHEMPETKYVRQTDSFHSRKRNTRNKTFQIDTEDFSQKIFFPDSKT